MFPFVSPILLLLCCNLLKNELCGQNMFLRIFHPLVKILFHCCHKLRFDILRQCPQFPHLTPSGAFSGDSLNGNSHPTNILPQIKTFLIEVCPKSAKFRAWRPLEVGKKSSRRLDNHEASNFTEKRPATPEDAVWTKHMWMFCRKFHECECLKQIIIMQQCDFIWSVKAFITPSLFVVDTFTLQAQMCLSNGVVTAKTHPFLSLFPKKKASKWWWIILDYYCSSWQLRLSGHRSIYIWHFLD